MKYSFLLPVIIIKTMQVLHKVNYRKSIFIIIIYDDVTRKSSKQGLITKKCMAMLFYS